MHAQTSYMDIRRHFVSNGRWYTTWFLTVEKIFPIEDEAPKLWLRSPKQLEQEVTSHPLKSVANKKLQFFPIAMNIKINIKDIVGKVGPNGIIIKN
jgi:hypothetical protein